MIIDPTRAAFGVVVTGDVAPSDRDAVLQTSLAHTQQFMASAPGFAGSTWLIRDDPGTPPPDQPSTERVVQYVQWQTHSQADAYLAEPIRAAGVPAGPHSPIQTTNSAVYHVDEVISADGLGRAVIDDSGPNTAPMTGIITFLPAAGKQAWIDEYNRSETRDYIQYLPGFVSASFLLADRDQRLTEFVQWNSMDAFQAALRDERFHEHVNVTNHYSTSEVGIYRVHQTITRASRRK